MRTRVQARAGAFAGAPAVVATTMVAGAGPAAADDILPDGYGIEAHLSDGRIATTRGHSANHSDETSGDLTEGTTWQMWVCVVTGSFSKCSSRIGVTA
ncbi:hypothetical protein [Streptomyces scabiei]|uniref:hypothetical protein n=1 Tax=Streptomyces scabiei TaxID=1930 RepID=UPI0029BA6C7C|nr:hypothetical protein [Streptomyces scabiei]MDX3520912.1 hypothetical protein [Streptomyces scabiei]